MGIKQPDKTDKDRFYKIYSTKKFKLRRREDIYLDLKFNIQSPKKIVPWLNLLLSMKDKGLRIENYDWASITTKENTIQLHILKRSFRYTTNIKKNQCIGFIFLLGEKYNDIITTRYNLL